MSPYLPEISVPFFMQDFYGMLFVQITSFSVSIFAKFC